MLYPSAIFRIDGHAVTSQSEGWAKKIFLKYEANHAYSDMLLNPVL